MLRDQIHATPEYRELSVQGQADQPGQQPARTTGHATTVGDALGPVLNWEKGDVEFWLQIAQLVVLLLILNELRGET
jgi:hypothetical protein